MKVEILDEGDVVCVTGDVDIASRRATLLWLDDSQLDASFIALSVLSGHVIAEQELRLRHIEKGGSQ